MNKKKLSLIMLPLVTIFSVGMAIMAQKESTQQIKKADRLAKEEKDVTKVTNEAMEEKQPQVTDARDTFSKLFQIDWTLPDQKAMDARAELMSPLVSDEVRNNSLDFKPDPDKTLEQNQISANFDHMIFMPTEIQGDTLKAKVLVYVKSSGENKASGTVRYAYNVAYDTSSKKITQLDRIGTFQLQASSEV